ncbi:MAG TPA: DUF455 family protein [Polyangiales bacterium]|nr:DUF455 family protein [Polyangiales bacterium]
MDEEREPRGLPRADTLQRWAFEYVSSESLAHKTAPGPVPFNLLGAEECLPLRLAQPGRPAELRVSAQKIKAPRGGALRDPKKRAALLHTFWHHELQAAELMCWAALAFPDTPAAFKRGLINICQDEIRHMQLYAAAIEALGFTLGDFPVRDWFWMRVPGSTSASAFLSAMGLGFEAGNLDHTRRFAEQFRAIGDESGARLQELVAEEEVPHVAFAVHWFRRFQGELSFAGWCRELPAPLSPMVMRGDPLNRCARALAGMDEPFLDALEQWQPTLPASPGS